jgi:hypothetical protein
MNCDQVFDVLTRGPFPTGGQCDQAVETHLLMCTDCRQLAEALRPAIELFEEAVTLEESRTLPGYWGNLHTGSECRVALALPVHQPRKLSRRLLTVAAEHATEVDWWRIAAAVLLGVLVGSWFRSAVSNDNRFDMVIDRATKPDVHLLASLSIPSGCRPGNVVLANITADGDKRPISSAGLSGGYACCTTCHNGSAQRLSQKSTSLVLRSCQACHD